MTGSLWNREDIWRIQIGRRIFLRRITRRGSAPAVTAILDSSSTHGRNTAARKAANRRPSCTIEIDRSRIELRRSHRGDETYSNRGAINLVQGAEFAAATQRRD